jgi:hypothetical protein
VLFGGLSSINNLLDDIHVFDVGAHPSFQSRSAKVQVLESNNFFSLSLSLSFSLFPQSHVGVGATDRRDLQ